ncbi:L,D-transpeptidase-like protein [Pseudonocardia sediminis]|uniref:L,D-transpeptidase-like protein n=1 Tax=Pseudonocardia sediminis TaxID=1397368 RepID=A0A4Q7UYK6_PSEST|nr:L,D-transpeptidase [Pseudonocardia sediminis]RZT86061.1 L,D-transpeptidase-like protein [Pseudonocardia sediminis]
MVRTTGRHDAPTDGCAAGRRRRVLAVVTVGLLAGVGAAGTAVAAPDTVDGTPCAVGTRACVDLENDRAWLIRHGEIEYGPVTISHGGQGRETPTGAFSVQRKDAHHRSKEFDDAPMPWAVFFAPGGIAFHEGNPETPSAGCVRMPGDDARTFYEGLEPYDRVEVH